MMTPLPLRMRGDNTHSRMFMVMYSRRLPQATVETHLKWGFALFSSPGSFDTDCNDPVAMDDFKNLVYTMARCGANSCYGTVDRGGTPCYGTWGGYITRAGGSGENEKCLMFRFLGNNRAIERAARYRW